MTCSHEVSPEFREYERAVTTVANAALRPVCRYYLLGLDALASEALVMTSEGGLVPAVDAAERPAALLLSGPAGGVRGGGRRTRVRVSGCGLVRHGGTSTDVCLVRGVPELAPSRIVAGYPIRLPALDIHTIGAVAARSRDSTPVAPSWSAPRARAPFPDPPATGAAARVPRLPTPTSCSAYPCWSRVPGLGRLDMAAARRALDRKASPQDGVVAVVDAAMERAVRGSQSSAA